MELTKACEIMENIKNGTFGTVEYETSIPVNKEAKKAGIQIFCKTKKMVRFGADYKNLVKESENIEVKPRTNNYSWVVDNKVAYNSNTDKNYLRVSNINRKTIERTYCMVTESAIHHFDKLELAEKFLQPSYSKNKSYSKPVVQNISLENIISINGIN